MIKNREQLIIILLIAAAVILAAVCILIYMFSDRKAPVITVNKEYLETCDLNSESDILKAVSAIDDKAETVEILLGDIVDFGDGTFKIYFVARDDSGNTSTASVIVQNSTILVKNIRKEADSTGADGSEQENGSNSMTEAPEESTDEVSEAGETSAAGSPVIKLNTNQTEIILGAEFKYLNYIESITDDKDSMYDLYKRIIVEGDYNFIAEGQYDLYYYVTDLDGNKSNTERLTVVVKAE